MWLTGSLVYSDYPAQMGAQSLEDSHQEGGG